MVILLFLLAIQQPQIFWMGRVTAVESNKIYAISGPQGTLTNLTITLATGARVWKKSTSADFSAVRVGDEVWVRGYMVAEGELVATAVYANITRITGRVTKVFGNEFQVDVFDVRGDRRGELTTVLVDAQTITPHNVSLRMSDVKTGQYVDIIGLQLSDGRVAAARVEIHD